MGRPVDGHQTEFGSVTQHRYQGIIDTWIEQTSIGNMQVGKVTHLDVQAWVNAQDCASASVVKHHRVLSQVLDLAVRDRRIPSNPATGVNLPRVAHKKRRYLTAAEVERLAAAAGQWRMVVLLLAYTGLRWGEMAALRVSDVDMLRRRVHVTRSVTVVDGRFVWGEPKSHEHRWVPVPQSVAGEGVFSFQRVGEGVADFWPDSFCRTPRLGSAGVVRIAEVPRVHLPGAAGTPSSGSGSGMRLIVGGRCRAGGLFHQPLDTS